MGIGKNFVLGDTNILVFPFVYLVAPTMLDVLRECSYRKTMLINHGRSNKIGTIVFRHSEVSNNTSKLLKYFKQ